MPTYDMNEESKVLMDQYVEANAEQVALLRKINASVKAGLTSDHDWLEAMEASNKKVMDLKTKLEKHRLG